MYCLRIASGAPPQEAAKYDGDLKCPCIEYLFTRPVNFARRRRADTPLSEFTRAEIAILGRVGHQQVHVVVLTVELG
jgi:hypothetical protein